MGLSYAEFARSKGERDNRKRNASIAAGVAGAAGVGAAGLRYGRAAARGMKHRDVLYRGSKNMVPDTKYGGMKPARSAPIRQGSIEDRARKGVRGVRGQVERDVRSVREGISTARSRAGSALSGAKTRAAGAYSGAKAKVGSMASSKVGRAVLGSTRAGRIARGAGALGAGAAGTAAVMAYLKNRKKKDPSLTDRALGAINRTGVLGKGRRLERRNRK